MVTFRTKDSMSIHVMFWLTLQARIADAIMNLDLVMLSVVMLSVAMLSVAMLSVVAHFYITRLCLPRFEKNN